VHISETIVVAIGCGPHVYFAELSRRSARRDCQQSVAAQGAMSDCGIGAIGQPRQVGDSRREYWHVPDVLTSMAAARPSQKQLQSVPQTVANRQTKIGLTQGHDRRSALREVASMLL
jgi:hypothetical protein